MGGKNNAQRATAFARIRCCHLAYLSKWFMGEFYVATIKMQYSPYNEILEIGH